MQVVCKTFRPLRVTHAHVFGNDNGHVEARIMCAQCVRRLYIVPKLQKCRFVRYALGECAVGGDAVNGGSLIWYCEPVGTDNEVSLLAVDAPRYLHDAGLGCRLQERVKNATRYRSRCFCIKK